MTTNGEVSGADAGLEALQAMKDNKPLSMGEILEFVTGSEDMDVNFILAGIINLYINAIRRTQSRTHIGPQDMQNILRICRTMITAPTYEKQFSH